MATALKTVDSALTFINSESAKLGCLQSRFETAITNLLTTSENLAASRSRMQDAECRSGRSRNGIKHAYGLSRAT